MFSSVICAVGSSVWLAKKGNGSNLNNCSCQGVILVQIRSIFTDIKQNLQPLKTGQEV